MMNRAGFAMHDFFGPNDMPTKYRANALLAEANTEKRELSREMLNDRHGDSGLGRRTRPGRDADTGR